MQYLWCWRCKCEMPMLDEQEYAEILSLYREGTLFTKRQREETGAALCDTPLADNFAPLLHRYEAITGFRETNHNAVMHHRLSLYGPP